MGLLIRLYDIVSPNDFDLSIGLSPYGPFTSLGSYSGSNTRNYRNEPIYIGDNDPIVPNGIPSPSDIVYYNIEFDTQYWLKIEDSVNVINSCLGDNTPRYIVENIYINDSKAFECYDRVSFNVVYDPDTCITPTPTPNPTSTPNATPNATPNPTATPGSTPNATPNPTLGPTPNPTSTPAGTAFPTPAPTSNPTSTPAPTSTPNATPNPTPAPTSSGDPFYRILGCDGYDYHAPKDMWCNFGNLSALSTTYSINDVVQFVYSNGCGGATYCGTIVSTNFLAPNGSETAYISRLAPVGGCEDNLHCAQ